MKWYNNPFYPIAKFHLNIYIMKPFYTLKSIFLCFLFSANIFAQPEYRSKANGNWTNVAIWEIKNAAGNFVATTSYPGGAGDIVSITHEVLLNRNLSVENLLIESTGHLTVGATLTLLDNSAQPELIVQGKLTNSGRISNGNMENKGEIVNNGTITAVALFNGTGQSLSGGGSWTSSLTVDNPFGLFIPTGLPNVNNLILKKGIIHPDPGAGINVNTITGYGPDKFVDGRLGINYHYEYDGGYVSGPFYPSFFPVGLNGVYLPVIFIPRERDEFGASGNETHLVGVEIVAGPPQADDLPYGIGEVSNVRHFKITHGGSAPVITYFDLEIYTAFIDGIDEGDNPVVLAKNSDRAEWEKVKTYHYPGRIYAENTGSFASIVGITGTYVISKPADNYLKCPSDTLVHIPIGQTSTPVNGLNAIVLPNDPGLEIWYQAYGATNFSSSGDPSGLIFNRGVTNLSYHADITEQWVTQCETKITVIAANKYYLDNDGDGYGDPNKFIYAENPLPPTGYVANSNDCNDKNAAINPGATEICGNGFDDNCNGITDEECSGTKWYRDRDNDGFGSDVYTILSDHQPSGYVAVGGDCRDGDKFTYPGAPESGDGIDNDCDGEVDEGLDCRKLWYKDADGDGIGRNSVTRFSCVPLGSNWVLIGGDCKDNDPDVYPGAAEICDGKNNDCDAATQEDCSIIITSNISAKPAAKINVFDIETLHVNLWPNPARNELMVSLSGITPNQKLEMVLLTADGRAVQSQSLIPVSKDQQVRFDVRNMATGYYLLRINQEKLMQTKKVMIVR